MKKSYNFLYLEDQAEDVALLTETLRREYIPCEVAWVSGREAYESALQGAWNYDLIFADYTLPDIEGLEALAMAKRLAKDIPFIFVSGRLGEESAVECLRSGATDYVLKTNLARLSPVVRRALEEAREAAVLHHAEATAQRAAALLRATLEANSEGILVLDLAGRVSTYNRKFMSLCGIPDYAMAPMEMEGVLQFLLDQFLDPQAFLAEARLLAAQPDRESFAVLRTREGRTLESTSRPYRRDQQTVGRVYSFRETDPSGQPMAGTSALQILHLHDQPGDAARLKETLEGAGLAFESRWVNSRRAFESALLDGWSYDLIVADHGLSGFPGPESLAMAQHLRPELPFLFLGTELDPATAGERLEEGAVDCQGLQAPERILHTVRRALRERRQAAALHEARAEATRAQALLRATLEATAEGLLVLDLAGKVTAYNHQFLTLCGIPEANMAPMTLDKVLGFLQDQFQDPEAFLTQAKLLAEPAAPERALFRDTRDGRILEGLRQPGPDPSASRVLSIRLGVAEKKAGPPWPSGVPLQDSERDALAVKTAAHARSHLLRIQDRLRLLEDSAALGAGPRTHLAAAATAAASLEAFLDRVSGPPMGPAAPPTALVLNALVEKALPRMEALAPRGVQLEVELDPAVPTLPLNAAHLEQVLMILLQNALDALEGAGCVRIRTGPLRPGLGPDSAPGAFLEFLDDGPGWPEALQERLFEPFFSTRPGAAGLGLWLARRILAPYGASLKGESPAARHGQDARGARFRLEFPGAGA